MRLLSAAIMAVVLAAGCKGESEGPLKGVLVVYPEGEELMADSISDLLQRTVLAIDPEPVFSFAFCSESEFEGSLVNRRTILFISRDAEGLPQRLSGEGPVLSARDLWARDQRVFGVVAGRFDPAALSDSLERAYDVHLRAYLFRSFVSTSMSSPERIDSLAGLGFTLDIPRSYSTSEWRPEDGFVQFQRPVSEEGLLMVSVRWTDGLGAMDAAEAVRWREEMARRFFYNASGDSVDRARLEAVPVSVGGASGWRLTGAWTNARHLNAGGFTSYVLLHGNRSFLLDAEVFNPGAEKEPYIREGWLLFETFAVEGQDG